MVVLLALLVLNYVIVSIVYAAGADPRVEIPCRPKTLAESFVGKVRRASEEIYS